MVHTEQSIVSASAALVLTNLGRSHPRALDRRDPMQRENELQSVGPARPRLFARSFYLQTTALTLGSVAPPIHEPAVRQFQPTLPRPPTPGQADEPVAPMPTPRAGPRAPDRRDPMQPEKLLRNGNPRGNPNAAPRCELAATTP